MTATDADNNLAGVSAPSCPNRTRAVEPLIIELDAGALYVSSPRVGTRIRVHREIVNLLLDARDGLSRAALESTPEGIATLQKLGFLCIDDVACDAPLPAPWHLWGALAWAFHERVRDVRFIRRGSAEQDNWRDTLEADRPPEPTPLQTRQRTEPALLLPRVRRQPEMPLHEVLDERRTHRRFALANIDIDRFATLLHYTLGPVRFADSRELGVLQLRASVSAGARHETYGCVAVFAVDGVPPGLYVYDDIRHGLVPLGLAADRERFEEFTGEQGWYRTGAFSIVTVADATKMAWKYRGPRAYRHLMNNVGAYAQVFSMTAHALGLGAAITGALADTAIEELLGITAPREFATFSLTCGVPDRASDGMPADYRHPGVAFCDVARS